MADPWEMDWAPPKTDAAPWEQDWGATPKSAAPEAKAAPAANPVLGGARQIASGLYDSVASTLGAPADVVHYLLSNTPGFLGGAPMGLSENPMGGSESIKKGMGKLGIYTPESLPAETTGDKLLQGIGSGIGSVFAPEAIVAGLGKAGMLSKGAVDAAKAVVGSTETPPQAIKGAIVGGAAGAGSEGAGELAPEPYKPLAKLAGSLAAGVPAALGAEAVPALQLTGRAVGDKLAPFTAEGQQSQAANTLRTRADNAEDVLQNIAEGGHEIVPNSQGTTAEVTGDLGLSGLQREVETRNPQPFLQRRADQNQARVDALGEVQPTGSVNDAADLFRTQILNADRDTNEAVTNATTHARAALDMLGGQLTPEQYGSALRSTAERAERTAWQGKKDLWEAVDPDGSFALPMDNVATQANKLMGEIDPLAGQKLSPREQEMLDLARSYSDGPQPLSRWEKFRSELSSEMRNNSGANPNAQLVRRFTILKNAADQDMADAISQRVTQDRQAVSAGQMAPQDTIEARLAKQAAEWQAGRAGQSLGTGTVGAPSIGEASSGLTLGRAEPAGGEPSGTPGNQGVPSPQELAPVDAAAAERYTAAKNAEIAYHRTFDEGPAGAVLDTRNTGGYKLLDSAVPAKVFHPGPTGFEDVQSFRQAVGDETALPVLTDYAVSDLRRSATHPDGTLDPAGLDRWRARNSEALRAFPDLDARLTTVQQASQAMEDAAALRRDTLAAFQGHAAAKLMNAASPEDATKIIGGMLGSKNATQQIRQLVDQAHGDQNAIDGLRHAVAEFIRGKFISNTEAATSGTNLMKSDAFQTFLRQNVSALRQLLSPEEMTSLNNIAADLHRSNRSITAAKLPGRSNTAQDTFANQRSNPQASIMSTLAAEGVGAAVGKAAAGFKGSVMGAIGVAGANALRNAGLRRVDQVLTEALLHPEFAAQLLRRFPQKPDITIGPSIARSLKKLAVAAPLQATYH